MFRFACEQHQMLQGIIWCCTQIQATRFHLNALPTSQERPLILHLLRSNISSLLLFYCYVSFLVLYPSPRLLLKMVTDVGFCLFIIVQTKNQILQKVMSNISCHSVFDIFAMFDVLHQLESYLRCQVSSKRSTHTIML